MTSTGSSTTLEHGYHSVFLCSETDRELDAGIDVHPVYAMCVSQFHGQDSLASQYLFGCQACLAGLAKFVSQVAKS